MWRISIRGHRCSPAIRRTRARAQPPPPLIAQSGANEVVDPAITRAHARAACKAGARLRWLGEATGDHGGTSARTGAATVDWLADRFAGKPAPRDCGRL